VLINLTSILYLYCQPETNTLTECGVAKWLGKHCNSEFDVSEDVSDVVEEFDSS